MNDKNSLNLKIKPIGPYWVMKFDLTINEKLRASDYLPFSPDLKFAGRSKIKGMLLSHPTHGTPSIDGVTVVLQKPKDWMKVDDSWHNLVIRTDKPSLKIFISKEEATLYMDPKDLVERTVFKSQRGYQEIECLPQTAQLIDLHVRDKTTLIHFDDYEMHFLVPTKHKLPQSDWHILERHIASGEATADYAHTIPAQSGNSCIKLKGDTLPETERIWGVTGEPEAWNKGELVFHSIEVINSTKAKQIHPSLTHFKELIYRYSSSSTMEVTLDEMLTNPAFSHAQTITFDDLKDKPLLESSKENIKKLKTPAFHGNTVFIPKKLADKFITPLTKAAHTHLCSKLQQYLWHSEEGLKGQNTKFLLNSDLAKTPKRNRKSEKENQAALYARLEAVGAPIPKNLAKLEDKDLDAYIRIHEMKQNDEIIPVEDCEVISSDSIDYISDWMDKHKLLFDCPVTNDRYIKNFSSLEELAEIPGFLKQLSEIFDDFKLFKRCMLSDKVRSLLVAESL